MRSSFSRTLRALLATLVLAIMGAGCADSAPDDSNTVAIGLLLPYTGSGSATAANFERAVLYAADRINAAGGIQGRRIRIVPRDTHSDIGRGRQAANELVAEGAAAVLGAESAEIAADLAPTLADHDVVLVSPLVGAANDPTTDCGRAWYRLAPSAQALGAALAKVDRQDDHRSDGQELRLPVLQRAVPEVRRGDIGRPRDRRCLVVELVGVVVDASRQRLGQP